MEFSARRSLLLDAVDAALKGLSTVPQDASVVQLIQDAQRLRRDVEAWGAVAPPEDQIRSAEKRVLSIHIAVAEVLRDDRSPG